MTMMNIRPMGMMVSQFRVCVNMVMRFLSLTARVQVLVMFIVQVPMAVGQDLVGVLMLMRLMGQNPKSKTHDCGRNPLKVTRALT